MDDKIDLNRIRKNHENGTRGKFRPKYSVEVSI